MCFGDRLADEANIKIINKSYMGMLFSNISAKENTSKPNANIKEHYYYYYLHPKFSTCKKESKNSLFLVINVRSYIRSIPIFLFQSSFHP